MSNNIFVRIWRLYYDGFKNMTWGKPLWFLIFLKVFILFAILRVFFFKPHMSGKTNEQKSSIVVNVLTKHSAPNQIELNDTE